MVYGNVVREVDVFGEKNLIAKKKWSWLFYQSKPIGASPGCDYVLERMVLQII